MEDPNLDEISSENQDQEIKNKFPILIEHNQIIIENNFLPSPNKEEAVEEKEQKKTEINIIENYNPNLEIKENESLKEDDSNKIYVWYENMLNVFEKLKLEIHTVEELEGKKTFHCRDKSNNLRLKKNFVFFIFLKRKKN